MSDDRAGEPTAEWLAALQAVYIRLGMDAAVAHEYVHHAERWADYWQDGCTPEEAAHEDMSHDWGD